MTATSVAWHPDIDKNAAVRYAWDNKHAKANLAKSMGFSASSFFGISGIDERTSNVDYQSVNGDLKLYWNNEDHRLDMTISHNGVVEVTLKLKQLL